jgi:hypothetical protein
VAALVGGAAPTTPHDREHHQDGHWQDNSIPHLDRSPLFCGFVR